MGSRLKALGIGLAAFILIFAVVWVFSDQPSFGTWLANASEAEASFWGAIIGALSSGMIAITILAADMDHREQHLISRRLSLARALKAEIADTLTGLTAGTLNIKEQARLSGSEIPISKISTLFTKRPLLASPPEAIYELGEEIGQLFAGLSTMFIKIEINSDGFTYKPDVGAPLLEASIRDATIVGSKLLAAIDRIDGEANDLSETEWRTRIVEEAEKSFKMAQLVRARAGTTMDAPQMEAPQ